MTIYSLDSSFVVDVLKSNSPAVEVLEEIWDEKLLFPSLAKAEVTYGSQEIGKFDELETIKFSEKEINYFISLKEFISEPMEVFDLEIASQAVSRDSVLLTGDSDFEKLEGFENFRVRNYRGSRKD